MSKRSRPLAIGTGDEADPNRRRSLLLTSHDLRVLLLHRRITIAEIARELSVHRTFVSQVVNGHRATPYVQQAIARRLNMPIDMLFPLTADEGEKASAPSPAFAR